MIDAPRKKIALIFSMSHKDTIKLLISGRCKIAKGYE
jgi:hypothetical protein